MGDEVYAAFEQAAFDMEAIAEHQIKRCSDATDPSKAFQQKWHINLPLANRNILEHMGVKPENIIQSDVCTYDSTDRFFSARRLGTESGRIYTAIYLK